MSVGSLAVLIFDVFVFCFFRENLLTHFDFFFSPVTDIILYLKWLADSLELDPEHTHSEFRS